MCVCAAPAPTPATVLDSKKKKTLCRLFPRCIPRDIQSTTRTDTHMAKLESTFFFFFFFFPCRPLPIQDAGTAQSLGGI